MTILLSSETSHSPYPSLPRTSPYGVTARNRLASIYKAYRNSLNDRQSLLIDFIYRFCVKLNTKSSLLKGRKSVLCLPLAFSGAETRKGGLGVILSKAPRQTPAFLPLDLKWNQRGKGDPSTYHERERAGGIS